MHNEICFSPHNAILYNGNDHLIEYNDIHDVVLYSMDAGAIYSGRDWAAHGTVIRYNLIKNVGTDDLQPDGIYWDDGLSGQTAYGNIIINVKKFGILAGGGRDNVIRNNIIIGDSQYSLIYDARAYYGYFEDAWFRNCVKIPDGGLWKSLRAVPYKKGIWAEKYPTLAGLTEDAAMATSPDFPVNPANVIVEGNIIISTKEAPMRFSRPLYRYAQLGENPVYTSCEEAGFDLETLKFEKIPEGFEEIPIGKIGRFVITT